MILTYKYRLKGKRSVRQLRRFAYAVNQVWNYCVQTQRAIQNAWKLGLSPKWPSFYELKALAAGTSKKLGLHSQTIQNVCQQFVESRDQHEICPRFRHSGGSKRSLGWIPFQRQGRQITSNTVTYLKNTYRFFGAKCRPVPATTKGGCFVEDARGRWWVCFHVDISNVEHVNIDNGPIGIDLGLKSLATLSTGKKIEAPRTYRLWEDKLIVAQRANKLDRVRAIHEKIANIRRDHLHKESTKIVREFSQIFIGDLSSSSLAKTSMSKSAIDAGLSTFRNFVRYKASRHGRIYGDVNERLSTQICSACGDLPESRPRGIADLGIREWRCSSCGALHDRDVNAAKNILAFGLSAQPLVEGSRAAYGRQPDRHDFGLSLRLEAKRDDAR